MHVIPNSKILYAAFHKDPYILGPLLFILYINDITSTSNVLDFILFADDTTILYSHENIESQISVVNAELKEVSNWFKANKLSVNASKTIL